jgi:hypothetical protein
MRVCSLMWLPCVCQRGRVAVYAWGSGPCAGLMLVTSPGYCCLAGSCSISNWMLH